MENFGKNLVEENLPSETQAGFLQNKQPHQQQQQQHSTVCRRHRLRNHHPPQTPPPFFLKGHRQQCTAKVIVSVSVCVRAREVVTPFPPRRKNSPKKKIAMNELIVLNVGYSAMEEKGEEEEEGKMEVMVANCTCTLIKSHDCNIIVDTMTPWDGDLLLQRLQEHQLAPDDISWVVSTHGHSDHLGNNNLFLKARHIVGTNISQRNRYFIHDFTSAPFRLSDTIEVLATPGHTLSCVSLLVRNCAIRTPGSSAALTVAICGDLFERVEDIGLATLWLEAGSEDPAAQRRNRARMAAVADFIVPGHGAGFAVTGAMREALNGQVGEEGLGG